MHNVSDDLIHFVGDWTTAERRALRRAIRTFERAWGASTRTSTADRPEWIVVQEAPSWGSYYFAHRLGTHDGLTGRSAAELASVIEHSSGDL